MRSHNICFHAELLKIIPNCHQVELWLFYHCISGDYHIYYTPGIYAAGYIVFALTFVRSSVRMFVRSLVRSCVRSFVTFRHVRRIYLKVFG